MTSFDMSPRRFDLLAELARFGAEHRVSLRDPDTLRVFTSSVRRTLDDALANPALLHGQRTEAMFEAMLISLGDFSVLKAEDQGRVYPRTGFRVPDFRVVLTDLTQWLIEVKNVYEEDASKTIRRLMNKEYREELENYASATAAELKLAVFWARWGIWTLVSPARFVNDNGNLDLNMVHAMEENELVRLGDRTVGTRPPLRILFTADPEKTSPIAPDGKVKFTIGNAQIFCGQEELVDAVERQIAWIFMHYGRWEEAEPVPIRAGNLLKGIEFRWEPPVESDQGFAMVGALSEIFSRYYAEKTFEDREVAQLFAEARPDWFAPFVKGEQISDALPLWIFSIYPKSSD